MEKNARLADIYIKIYNKRPLTMEDLHFLAVYDRDCFEKTCRNLLYKIPEAEKLMQSESKDVKKLAEEELSKEVKTSGDRKETAGNIENAKPDIGALLENLKKMEWQELTVQNISESRVKNLLGSLYMEMLFPHNDRYRYFQFDDHTDESTFNRQA